MNRRTTLALALAVDLALAPGVLAAPDAGDAGAAKTAAKTAAKPAARPAAKPDAKPDDAPRKAARPRRTTRKELAQAEAERARVRSAVIHEWVKRGPSQGVLLVDNEAERTTDPVLKIEASKYILAAPTTTGTLRRAERHTRAALDLVVEGPRLPEALVAQVNEDGADLLLVIEARRDGLRSEAEARRAEAEARRAADEARRAAERRVVRGTHEMIAGGAMLTLAALGGGLAIGGAVAHAQADEARERLEGSAGSYDLAPLAQLDRRGTAMIAAGAVLALVGAGAGVPLLVLGARDRRAGRRARDEAGAVEIGPTLGGVVVRGRF